MKRTICLFILLYTGVSWAQPPVPSRPDSASRIEPKRFIEFDTSEFPPKPKGYTQATDPSQTLRVTPSATVLNEQQIMALRQRAEADARLKRALGERYIFLAASLVDTGNKAEATPKQDVRLEYFNYVTNRAVHVRLSGTEVKTVQVQPKEYQPPESNEEVATAEKIVRQDPRYKEAVEGLPARGILTPAPENKRYIYLMFKN